MLTRTENQYGKISLDKTLVYQILQNAMEPWAGKAWIANYKGQQSDAAVLLGSLYTLYEVHMEMRKRGLFLRVYLMIRFGESISEICRNICQTIVDDTKALLGLDVDDVELVVTAVLSKRASQREIVFTYRNMDVGPVNMIEAEEALKENAPKGPSNKKKI